MFNTSTFNTATFNGTGDPAPPVTEYDDLITEALGLDDVGDTYLIFQLLEAIGVGDVPSSNFLPNSTISENIRIILEQDGIASAVLSELMRTNSSVTSQIVMAIYENIIQSSTLTSQGNFGLSLLDAVTVADTMRVVFPIVLTNNISASSTFAEVLNKYNIIVDEVRATGVFSTAAEMNSVISAAIVLSAVINQNTFIELLSEGLELSDELVELYTATESILNALSVDDLLENSVTLTVITSEDIEMSLSEGLNANYSSTIEEDAVFIISYKIEDTIYQGYSYSPETFSVTEYDNFNFNSSAFFNYNYLFANETGLYLLGGDMDDDQFITAKIKTATMDFETSNLKQVPKVYLGVSNDSSLILSVSIDGKYRAQYELQLDSDDLSTQMFNIGKGLVGRYWQFTVETKGNTSFDLDELEIYPIIFGRKR